MTINPSKVTAFVGANIKKLNRLVVDIVETRESYEAVKSEEIRVGNIVLAENVYIDEDEDTRIFNAQYAWGMSNEAFDDYLTKRIALLKESKLMKKHFPDIDESMKNKTFDWFYNKPLIDFEREILDFMKPVLGFDANDVLCLKKRAEAIEIISGLVLTHPLNHMGLTRV